MKQGVFGFPTITVAALFTRMFMIHLLEMIGTMEIFPGKYSGRYIEVLEKRLNLCEWTEQKTLQ